MTVLIILSYWEGFRSAKFPLFIENIVMLFVALSGFCPIHFTVIFSGTFGYTSSYQEYCYIKDRYMGVPLYPFRIMAFFTYKHYGHDMTA